MNTKLDFPTSTPKDDVEMLVIGIDLGTTNSLMAVARAPLAGDRLLLPSEDLDELRRRPTAVRVELLQLSQMNLDGTISEDSLFPSVVYQEDAASQRYVGMGAKEAKFTERKGKTVFYSVKRDMGKDMDPCYPSAVTPELDTPVKVSTVILRAMREAAEAKLGRPLGGIPVVITTPASFQSAQRRATLDAAIAAGFHVDESHLFDEPNAALLAQVNRRNIQARWHTEETVLVFDFGGGTCDISIIDTTFAPVSGTIQLKNRAISRYEELGGDDIDKHLALTRLAPLFYSVSGRAERDWSAAERRHLIWSQLYKLAEMLKIRICEELERKLQGAEHWDAATVASVAVSLPAQEIRTNSRMVTLPDLSLTGSEFEQIIAPFIDPKCGQNRDHEHYKVTSIFTPILDALEKAGLKPGEITRVLLVGGSSRNPLIEAALKRFFKDATVDRPNDLDHLVAEGAALQAYYRFVRHHDMLTPIAGDTIGLLTDQGGFAPFIPAGTPIPFPEDDGWVDNDQFRVPRAGMSHLDLVICAGAANRPIHEVQLKLSKAVPANTTVRIRVRLDEAKIFRMRALLPAFPDVRVETSIENPLALVPSTPEEQQRAEYERDLARAQKEGTLDQHLDDIRGLTEVLGKLGRHETALEWANQAVRRAGGDDPSVRHLKAMCHFNLGEKGEAHKIWRELSDRFRDNDDFAFWAGQSATESMAREIYLRRALSIAPDSPYYQTRLGYALKGVGNAVEAKQLFRSAVEEFERRLGQDPEDRNAMDWLAWLYDLQGRTAEAAQMRKRYQAIKPSARPAYKNLPSVSASAVAIRD